MKDFDGEIRIVEDITKPGPFAKALLNRNKEITIGNIRIVKLKESPDKILLQYIPGGLILAENGQFNLEKFEQHIENFFHENF